MEMGGARYTSPINDVTQVEERLTMLHADRKEKKADKHALLGTKDMKAHPTPQKSSIEGGINVVRHHLIAEELRLFLYTTKSDCG